MFKVGDWVTWVNPANGNKELTLIKTIEDKEAFDEWGEELWQPKEGEWCWFYNTGEGKPFCGKFVTIIQKNNYTTYRAHNAWHECEYCEPFIGELPTFLQY